jgi:hypothetical protein
MSFDSFLAWVVRTWRSLVRSLPWGLSALVGGTREEISVERHRYEGLVIYEVTSDEIANLKAETLRISEDLAFAIAGISIGLSFLVVLFTVEIPSTRVFDAFFILFLVGIIVGAYCGFRWIRGRKSFETTIGRIEKRVGPLGQEGKENTGGPAGATGHGATGATGPTGASGPAGQVPGTPEIKSEVSR